MLNFRHKNKMKKIILSIVAICAFTFANAQDKKESGLGFSKGDVFATGSLSLGSSNNKDTDFKSNGFQIAPQVNYFVSENISIGARIGYQTSKGKSVGVTVVDNTTFSFGLAGRYYVTPASQFSVFAELGADYGSTKNNLTTVGNKINGFNVAFAPGLNYFVSNKFSIEAKLAVLDFNSSKSNATGAKGTSSFGLGLDLSAVSFGVNYKF